MEHIHSNAGTPQPQPLDLQYQEFRQQMFAPPLAPINSQTSHQTPHFNDEEAEEDLDMDAQLENVSPERGSSSLQLTYERNSKQAATTLSKPIHTP